VTQANLNLTAVPNHGYRNGAIMVIFCGLLWSTAGLGVRYIDAASGWHIVFYRSFALVLTMLMVMAWRSKGDLVTPLKRTSKLSILAGLFMGASFFGNIFALLHTSVANVTFLLSSSPFIAALLGWIFLGERVKHIVFYRSFALVLTMLMVMAWRSKGDLVTPLKRTSKLSILAGLFMGASFFGNIFALLHTSVANVTFLLSSSPFIAALLGWILLGERVKKRTWAAIGLTSIGVSVMVGNELNGDGIIGMAFALMMAICYAVFSVIMRRGKDNDMLPAALVAGLFSMAVAGFFVPDLSISWNDLGICLALGFFQMGLAMALFITGSKHVPAAELTLLTMLEVILSPIWVWLAFNEHPGYWTLVGGSIIMLGVLLQAVGARRRHPQPQVF